MRHAGLEPTSQSWKPCMSPSTPMTLMVCPAGIEPTSFGLRPSVMPLYEGQFGRLAGFEPTISAFKAQCPCPLDDSPIFQYLYT